MGGRRRGRIELRRGNDELGDPVSSSGNNSAWDTRLGIPRGSRFLGCPEAPFNPDRTGLLLSRLPGRRTSAEPLRAFRGCRDDSRPSKYPFDRLDR